MTDRPLIFKIGGAGVDHPDARPKLWAAVAEAHALLRGQLVLVHGGGRAVDQHLDRLGMVTQRREGIRITPPEQVNEIAGILAGRINKRLVGAIQRHGVRAVGLCLGDGGAVTTAHTLSLGFDAGRVGEIIGGDCTLLRLLIAHGFLPVLSSIGLDENGSFLNINADDAAAGIARLLNARALVLLSDVQGILGEDAEPIHCLSPEEVDALIVRGKIHGGMIPKARAAVHAANAAGAPAIIASFNSPSDLVALAAGKPIGTRITGTCSLIQRAEST